MDTITFLNRTMCLSTSSVPNACEMRPAASAISCLCMIYNTECYSHEISGDLLNLQHCSVDLVVRWKLQPSLFRVIEKLCYLLLNLNSKMYRSK